MSEFILWGYHPTHQREPIKLSGGTRCELSSELYARDINGWTCAIYPEGAEPRGLRLLAQAEPNNV